MELTFCFQVGRMRFICVAEVPDMSVGITDRYTHSKKTCVFASAHPKRPLVLSVLAFRTFWPLPTLLMQRRLSQRSSDGSVFLWSTRLVGHEPVMYSHARR